MANVLPIRVTPRSAKPGIGGWRAQEDGREELEVRVAEDVFKKLQQAATSLYQLVSTVIDKILRKQLV